MAKYFLVGVSYYIGNTATPLQTDTFACTTTAAATFAGQNRVEGASLVVNCPTGCAANTGSDRPVYSSAANQYLITSSACRAAIHAGIISDTSGGPVQLTITAGGESTRTWLTGVLRL